MMALVGLLAFNFPVVLPVLAQESFNGGGGTYGLLSAALSDGAVVGSASVGLVPHPRRRYLVAAATLFGLALAATAAAPTVAIAGAALVVTGIAGFVFVTMTSTTLQLHATPSYRGRIVRLFRAAPRGPRAAGTVASAGQTALTCREGHRNAGAGRAHR
jgi:hypothetical protein